jgi:DNA processing protein
VLVTDADDVIEQVGRLSEDLAPLRQGPARAHDALDRVSATVLDAVPRRGVMTEAALALVTGVSTDGVIRCLGALEAGGWVTRKEGGWQLCPNAPKSGP